MDQTYKVIFTGELHPETSSAQAQAAMVEGFGLSFEKAGSLLQKKKSVIIKKGVHKEQGQKLCRRLSDIGLIVKLVREKSETSELATPKPPKPPMPPVQPTAEIPRENVSDTEAVPPTLNPYAAPEAQLATADAGTLQRSDPQKLSAGQGYRWLVDAFGMFKARPLAWIGAVTCMYILIGSLSAIPIIGMFAGTFLSPIFFGGMMLGAHQQAEGDRFLFKSVFGGFSNNRNQLLLLGLFSVIGLFVCMLPFLVFFGATFFTGQMNPDALASSGVVSLIVGGLLSGLLTIPYYMCMWFAPTIVAVTGENAWSAIKLSLQATKRNMLPFLIYTFIMMGGLAVFGVGAAILIPALASTGFESMVLIVGLLSLVAIVVFLPAAVVVLISVYTAYRSIFYR